MNTHAVPQPRSTATSSFIPGRGLLLQRKCACGGGAGTSGECEACRSKRLLQTELAIGASNDPLEQDADRVADQVLAAPGHASVSDAGPRIQRFTGQPDGEAEMAPGSVDHVLAGSGSALEPTLRHDMEQRFGYDFSRVRVHADAAAEQSALDLSARAFTVGQDIVFGAGRFAPGARDGRRLIAHELTHAIQQGASPHAGLLQRDTEQSDCEAARKEQDPEKARDPEEVKVLCAADRARKHPKDDTRMMISASEIVYRLARLYLPKQAERISGVGFSGALEGVRVETVGNSISITVGKRFVLGTTSETLLKRVIELRSAILAKTRPGKPDYAKGRGLLYQLGSPHKKAASAGAPAQTGTAKPDAPKPHEPDDLDQVAIPALKNILCRTRDTGLEHCGNIIRSADGALRASGPYRGEVGICNALDRVRQDESRVGYYHSHPAGQGLGFSKPGMNGRTVGDTEEAEDNRIDYYLINSEGEMLRYIPSRDEYRNGRHLTIGKSGVTCPEGPGAGGS